MRITTKFNYNEKSVQYIFGEYQNMAHILVNFNSCHFNHQSGNNFFLFCQLFNWFIKFDFTLFQTHSVKGAEVLKWPESEEEAAKPLRYEGKLSFDCVAFVSFSVSSKIHT